MDATQKNIGTQRNEEEITLKVIILRVQDIVRFLLRKWLIILIGGIIGAGLGITLAYIKKPNYVAEITFTLEEKGAGALGAYSGLASQFGIDLGGSSSSVGAFSGDNILQFLQSRLMIEKTLLTPVIVNNVRQTLADLYISSYNLHKRWEDDPTLASISFPAGQRREKFSLSQDSILNVIQLEISKKRLEISKPDKKLSFISVKCTSLDQPFSKIFTEQLVTVATAFYVETKTKRAKVNVDKLQFTADSLESLLNQRTYALAKTQDINQNPARQISAVPGELQARNKLVVQTMYTEVIKNLELSKMSMAQEQPVIQIVDSPILPLEKVKLGKLKGLIIGGFLGAFFIIGFLVVRRAYQKIMYEE